MQRYLMIVLVLHAFAPNAIAEPREKPLPTSILGFLETGMHVGVGYIDGTKDVLLFVYDADEYAVALEIPERPGASIDAEAFASKHKLVREMLDRFIAKEKIAPATMTDRAIRAVRYPRTILGTIQGIGEDYIFIVTGEATKRRIVYSRSSIGRIYLDSNPIMFQLRRREP